MDGPFLAAILVGVHQGVWILNIHNLKIQVLGKFGRNKTTSFVWGFERCMGKFFLCFCLFLNLNFLSRQYMHIVWTSTSIKGEWGIRQSLLNTWGVPAPLLCPSPWSPALGRCCLPGEAHPRGLDKLPAGHPTTFPSCGEHGSWTVPGQGRTGSFSAHKLPPWHLQPVFDLPKESSRPTAYQVPHFAGLFMACATYYYSTHFI